MPWKVLFLFWLMLVLIAGCVTVPDEDSLTVDNSTADWRFLADCTALNIPANVCPSTDTVFEVFESQKTARVRCQSEQVGGGMGTLAVQSTMVSFIIQFIGTETGTRIEYTGVQRGDGRAIWVERVMPTVEQCKKTATGVQ